MSTAVIIFNAGYDPSTGIGERLHTTSQRHAQRMIHRGVAEPVDLPGVDPATGLIAALVLTRMIFPSWTERRPGGTVGFSTRAVLDRDHWTCAFCGDKVSKTPKRQGLLATVDHVHPRSRGGATNWWNLVAACYDCNQVKSNLLLGEAGMVLRFDPYDPAVAYRDVDGSVAWTRTGRLVPRGARALVSA